MKKIEDIKNSEFLKDLNNEELEELAASMRQFILEKVSQNGGHLSANLGIVDLTIALLKVFDAKDDVLIFDVGHQSYPYKILTGRAKEFDTLRKKDGLSGFQSLSESKYDKYEAGHSSTSISAGVGFALARDLDKKKNHVISIIGDGSISNGLAYEALNHIGDIGLKQIIILNDNQMSISENVGALHNVLDSIRAGKKYNKAKKNTKNFLNKTKAGRLLAKGINNFKDTIKKAYISKGSIFDDFGIEYYGPINGHDYTELIKYLEIAKNETKPVILHVITQKGKGYLPAENDTIGKFHGISAFNIEDGSLKNASHLPSFSEIVSSYVYNYMRKDKDIIALTPGMSYGSKLETIKEKMPNQYIDVGICEEHALVVANSLALSGKKPIVFIYSTFLQRAYDELVHDIARMNSGVILCIDRAGLVPADGISHQGVFDIPFMMSIPNMIITQPKDAYEANMLLCTALKAQKPFAIRFPKKNLKYDYGKGEELEIGSWELIKRGSHGTIISYGDFLEKAINVAEMLEKEGINLNVVNARFIKPYDRNMFNKIAKTNKPIFVYEESMEIGSLGSVLASDIQKLNSSSKVFIYAINDEFLTHATRDELIEYSHLDEKSIIKNIKRDLK